MSSIKGYQACFFIFDESALKMFTMQRVKASKSYGHGNESVYKITEKSEFGEISKIRG
jgi:hypothetical protein